MPRDDPSRPELPLEQLQTVLASHPDAAVTLPVADHDITVDGNGNITVRPR